MSKKFTVHLPAAISMDKFVLMKLNKELIYSSPFVGKTVPRDGKIPFLRKGIVTSIFFDSKDGLSITHVDVDLDKLEAFVKDAKKARTKFRKESKKRKNKICAFWRHLTPELSFFFSEKVR